MHKNNTFMSLAAVFRDLVHKDGLRGVWMHRSWPFSFPIPKHLFSATISSIPDKSYSHFYTRKNFDRNYVPRDVSETCFYSLH